MAQFGERPVQKNPLEYAGQKNSLIPTFDAPRAPTVLDRGYPIQAIWRDNTTNDEYILVDITLGNAIWQLLTGGGAGNITNLRADDGNIALPNVGVIDIDCNTVVSGTNPTPFYSTAAVANIMELDVQVAAVAAASDINNAGLSSYETTHFTVDAAGFVDSNLSIDAAASNADNAGICSFDDAQFTVDADGYVQLVGGAAVYANVNVDANTPPGTDPVLSDGAGVIAMAGAAVAAHAVPIETHSRAANAFNIEVQVSSDIAGAPGNTNDAGVCSFDDTKFVVDADGYVSLIGGSPATVAIDVDANTGPGTDPVLSDGAGVIAMAGAAVAAHAVPIETHSRAANAFNVEVQVSSDRTGAPGNTNDAGVCSFSDAQFTVDADGYVTITGGGIAGWEWVSNTTLAGDANVTIIDLSASYSYMIWLENLVPANDSVSLDLIYSINNGASFLGAQHQYATYETVLGDRTSGANATIEVVGGTQGADTDEQLSGYIKLIVPTSANVPYCMFHLGYETQAGLPRLAIGQGRYSSSQAVNAVRLLFSAGNMASGVIRLYRLAQT